MLVRILLSVHFSFNASPDILKHVLVRLIGTRCLEYLGKDGTFKLWHELGVSEAPKVATIVENSGRVGHELRELQLCHASFKALLLQSFDASPEDELEQDEKTGAFVAPLEPADLGALPASPGHVVCVGCLGVIELPEGVSALHRVHI